MPFRTLPPIPTHCTLTFPGPNILLVTLSRLKDLNCISSTGHNELHEIWEWMDEEPSLRVGIITGEGRAFCAGADLKGKLHISFLLASRVPYDLEFAGRYLMRYIRCGSEWDASTQSSKPRSPMPPSGFGGLSRRSGKKPIIAAVNGLCLGGGM
ncbi:ClpP/crotonase-like domain-containing protein [Aspergillus desertorum]